MKNKIYNKLRSKDGASITFALLLFLVCAVLCSVILAAATAAAGRMSKIAETEQRYYAVTSAAELIKSQFEAVPSVSIVKVEKFNDLVYVHGADPAAGLGTADEVTVYIVPGKTASEIVESEDLIPANNAGTGGGFIANTIQKDAAKTIKDNEAAADGTLLFDKRALSLTPSGSGKDNALLVSILQTMNKEGNMSLTLYNTNNYDGTTSTVGNRYTLEMLYGADKSVTSSTKVVNKSSETVNDSSYSVTADVYRYTTTTLTWTLTEIKTITGPVS